MFDESQITGTVELVTDSTFDVAQIRIQGFPRQIPNGDPNRFPSLVLLGPALPGTGEVKQPSLLFFHVRHFHLFISDVHTFMPLYLIPFI